jgi:hypothetical protein
MEGEKPQRREKKGAKKKEGWEGTRDTGAGLGEEADASHP